MTPAACVATLQRILCDPWCHAPRTAEGPVPGGDCYPHGDGAGIFSPCDDGEGFCPAYDCKYFGQCVCACHDHLRGTT